jgi:hypothetical protein
MFEEVKELLAADLEGLVVAVPGDPQ